MKQREIYISDIDFGPLRELVNNINAGLLNSDEQLSYHELLRKLECATILPVKDVPYNIITMNSRIFLRDPDSGEKVGFELVFPEYADPARNKISILSSVGVSLLGKEVKDIINYEGTTGARWLKIEKLLYQPEEEQRLQRLLRSSSKRKDEMQRAPQNNCYHSRKKEEEKEVTMKTGSIHITDFDLKRLKKALQSARYFGKEDKSILDKLEEKIQHAIVTSQKSIPPYVVTMNSQVRLRDLKNKDVTFWLVFPHEAHLKEENVSILTPIGTAMFGRKGGDTIEYQSTTGLKQLRIARILYQPEASGHFGL